MVKDFEFKNVEFVGYQDPTHYYERASILVLTSDYEGFPLVLNECMFFGVVPVVFGSFASVYDIIDDELNGFVISKKNDDFDVLAMVDKLKLIMSDTQLLKKMSLLAMEKSSTFSINVVYEEWMTNLNRVLSK